MPHVSNLSSQMGHVGNNPCYMPSPNIGVVNTLVFQISIIIACHTTSFYLIFHPVCSQVSSHILCPLLMVLSSSDWTSSLHAQLHVFAVVNFACFGKLEHGSAFCSTFTVWPATRFNYVFAYPVIFIAAFELAWGHSIRIEIFMQTASLTSPSIPPSAIIAFRSHVFAVVKYANSVIWDMDHIDFVLHSTFLLCHVLIMSSHLLPRLK